MSRSRKEIHDWIPHFEQKRSQPCKCFLSSALAAWRLARGLNCKSWEIAGLGTWLAALEDVPRAPVKQDKVSSDLVEKCIRFAEEWFESRASLNKDITISPTTTVPTNFSPGGASSSGASFEPDPHAVSQAEALSYYAGLPSEPLLIYRTGKPWSPPKGPEAQRQTKELRPVFNHPMVDLWSDGLGDEVVKIMDTHHVFFTSIDVVRFKTVQVDEALSDEEDDVEEGVHGEPAVGPVTIWIGDVLALLLRYELANIDIDFRGSVVTREAVSSRLLSPVSDLDPLVDVVSPLTPALGLCISTTARPDAWGTMALYLSDGDGKLLGLTCRHVVIDCTDGNFDYEYHPHAPSKNVVLLGKKGYINLTDSIKLRIWRYGIQLRRWKKQIERFEERERGTDRLDVSKASRERIETQALVKRAEDAIKALGHLLQDVETQWKKPEDRIIGHVVRSPAIRLGVGEERFTEDWGVLRIKRSKLGDGYQGNKIDLGTEMSVPDFTLKCFPRGDADWQFEYPEDRLLPLRGVLTDKLMHHPDMWDSDGEPCLLVVKNGSATGTTIGRANGVFSIVREYFSFNMAFHQTSMEWGIINYDSKSKVFSGPGDSGSIIADIRGRIGGMLTRGAGKTGSSDITYATPFWWLLERIQNNGFPQADLDVVGT